MRQPTVTITPSHSLSPQSARRSAQAAAAPVPLPAPVSLPAMDERRLGHLLAMLGHAAMAEVLESYGVYLRDAGNALLDALAQGDGAAVAVQAQALMGAALELATPRLAALCRDLLAGAAPVGDAHTGQAVELVLLTSRAGVAAALHRCRNASPALPGQGVVRLRAARG